MDRTPSDDRLRILFLCTGNSARSIMAEAIANHRYPDRLLAFSAGSRPKDRPHPLALATLRRRDIDCAGAFSKPIEMFADESFDLVVTLCDSAAHEPCPAFPGAPLTRHWGLPDPPAADDPEAAFEQVYRTLNQAIELFITTDGSVNDRALATSRFIAELFPGG
jgi:protein-tyrosine-phosphatase